MSVLAELAKLVLGTYTVKSAIEGLSAQIGPREIASFGTSRGPMKLKTKQVYSLQGRMDEIIRLTRKGKLDPKIREFAANAVNKKCGNKWCVPERDYDGEIRSIFAAVRANVRYTGDIWSVDTFQHPVRTLQLHVGDCDDLSILLGSLLLSLGYPIRFRVIRDTNSSDWSHIFVLVVKNPRAPKEWVSLDASVSKPAGWHPPKERISAIKDFSVDP